MNLKINKLENIFESDLDYGYYDPDQDNYNEFSLDKPSQQKLSLKMINRIKKMRRTKSFEKSIKRELLGAMYGIDQDSEE